MFVTPQKRLPTYDLARFPAAVTRQTITRLAVATGLLAVGAVALQLVGNAHLVGPAARGAAETATTVLAILTIGLLVAQFQYGRRLADLLLVWALLALSLVDFVYSAIPGLTGAVGPESRTGVRLGCDLLVACAFAAAAFAPHSRVPKLDRRVMRVGAGSAATAIFIVALANLAPASAIHGASAALLVVSALVFLVSRESQETGRVLLAGAAMALAIVQLRYLMAPVVDADWITPREALRVVAYGLLLAGAHRLHARTRSHRAHAAIGAERERLARDLHDGLAQDLACIVAQGQRLDSRLGPDDPLIVATRHALAVSRGAIADLTASTAPTTEAALRTVADELGRRYDVQVEVRVEPDRTLAGEHDLEPSDREELVRIAREAIVNAAQHGAASHVDVVLSREPGVLMRVCDDGCGITDAQRFGFGLRTMRARAAYLGADLTARPRAGGGTQLELLVAQRDPAPKSHERTRHIGVSPLTARTDVRPVASLAVVAGFTGTLADRQPARGRPRKRRRRARPTGVGLQAREQSPGKY